MDPSNQVADQVVEEVPLGLLKEGEVEPIDGESLKECLQEELVPQECSDDEALRSEEEALEISSGECALEELLDGESEPSDGESLGSDDEEEEEEEEDSSFFLSSDESDESDDNDDDDKENDRKRSRSESDSE